MKTSLSVCLKKIFFLIFLILWSDVSFGQRTARVDSCGINDACKKSILIPNVISDQPFVCIEGC
ncbi:MAG: hypothetical protein ABJB16_13390, partial [Saprospiraceae bacterium]